jgi:hypothetical protein
MLRHRVHRATSEPEHHPLPANALRHDLRSNGIEHRLTKPNHPWTNGQVERTNRTIKDATVRRFHDDSHDQLRIHLADFMAACNFARRLKTLGGLTPCEYICKVRTSEPDRFILDPIHQMPGLNTWAIHLFPPNKFIQYPSLPKTTTSLHDSTWGFDPGTTPIHHRYSDAIQLMGRIRVGEPKCRTPAHPAIGSRHLLHLRSNSNPSPQN